MGTSHGPRRGGVPPIFGACAVLCACAALAVGQEIPASAMAPLVISWFAGTPYAANYIGEGDTVKWQWHDRGTYSVEGVEGAAGMFTGRGGGASVVSQVNFTYSFTFTRAGSYEYRCHNHPYIMGGRIIVKPKFNFGGVTIPWFLGISYSGASAIVQEGDTVTWRWSDDLPHALTALDGNTTMFGTGPGRNSDTKSGEGTFTVKKKFTTAGVYLYKCQNHGAQMFGNITVLPKNTTSAPPPKGDATSSRSRRTRSPPPAPRPPAPSPPTPSPPTPSPPTPSPPTPSPPTPSPPTPKSVSTQRPRRTKVTKKVRRKGTAA